MADKLKHKEQLQKTSDTYHAWRSVPDSQSYTPTVPPLEGANGRSYENTPGYCHSATLAEVQKQDYKLTPAIYVGTEAEADDGIPLEEKMAGLKAKLNEQFEENDRLQEKIRENLERI